MTSTGIMKYAAALVLGCVMMSSAHAQVAAGTASMIRGQVTVASPDGNIRALERGGEVASGDIIATAADSYANIVFSDGGRLLLRPNTRLVIDDYVFERNNDADEATPDGNGRSAVRLLRGGLRTVTGAIGRNDPENVEVRTPVATLGIRGTDFEVRMCAGDCLDVDPAPRDGLYAGVNRGTVVIMNAAGEVVSTAGQFAFVANLGMLPSSLPFRPRALGQDPMPDPLDCD